MGNQNDRIKLKKIDDFFAMTKNNAILLDALFKLCLNFGNPGIENSENKT